VAEAISRRLNVSPSQISVIPNGVETAFDVQPADLTREFGIPTGAPVVLGVGRLHPQKGFSKLISAFARVAERLPSARLLILGEGPEREKLQSQIQRAGLTGRVHLPGYRYDVPAVMRACSALVLTSLWEGMPNVVLEAMSVGLPVIAADVPGISELIPDETHGIVVSDGSISGFAAALERVLTDRRLADELGKMSQQFCREQFTWCSVAAEYGSLYESLLQFPALKQKPE
jgi:glycosyltransferase involved in cell wall biosynthesis